MTSLSFHIREHAKIILDTFLAVAFLLALSEPLTESKVAVSLRNSLASDVSGIAFGQILNNKGSFPIFACNRICR